MHAIVVAVIVLIGIAPVLSVVIASTVASANGCELHEGFANPCVIGGIDFGDTLYAMGVTGWLALVTLPLAALLGVAYVVFVAIALLWRRVKRPAASPQDGPTS